MKNHLILKAVNIAINQVLNEDRPLQVGVSERSVAHRLAVHLEPHFIGWDVDCEYNRQRMISKELQDIKGCNKQKKTDRIFPDIIVHQRTNDSELTNDENVLVVEIKNNDQEDVCDRIKLELLTRTKGYYKYQLGLYINFGNNDFKKTWYRNGSQINEKDLLK